MIGRINQGPTGVDSLIPRGSALKSYLAEVTSVVQQLENKIQSLPRVDENGHSVCPDAEDFFAQKEELESKLSTSVAMLHGYLGQLESEIARCKQNLERIGGGASELNVPAALDAFDDAETAQRDEYYAAVTDRDALVLVLSRANGVLQVSRSRKYPGKIPERKPFAPPIVATPDFGGPIGPGEPMVRGAAGDLLGMGPLSGMN